MYFCCLEALQNVAKYAAASARARSSCSERDGSLTFEVTDDGAGFDPRANGLRHRAQGMADRLAALGGELTSPPRPVSGR